MICYLQFVHPPHTLDPACRELVDVGTPSVAQARVFVRVKPKHALAQLLEEERLALASSLQDGCAKLGIFFTKAVFELLPPFD